MNEITFTIDEVRNMLIEIEANNEACKEQAYRELEDGIISDATCTGERIGLSEANQNIWNSFFALVYKAKMVENQKEEN